jgi:putative serine/threonine protein kinase
MPTLKSVKNTSYFTKGHRGILYTGEYKKKKVVIKTERKDSQALGRVENEVKYLKILNEKGIGPKLFFHDRKFTYFVYEFIDGDFFPIFLEHSTKKNKNLIKKIIRNIFIQCFRMDKIKVNKEEMHHPYKHIIIDKNTKKPVLVDFERAHKSREPRNVTQFSSYIISDFITSTLKERGIKVNREKIIAAAKKYKKDIKKANLDKIITHVK